MAVTRTLPSSSSEMEPSSGALEAVERFVESRGGAVAASSDLVTVVACAVDRVRDSRLRVLVGLSASQDLEQRNSALERRLAAAALSSTSASSSSSTAVRVYSPYVPPRVPRGMSPPEDTGPVGRSLVVVRRQEEF